MAWFQYNRGGRGLVSDMLQPLIGASHRGWPGRAVNVLAIVATAIGVATTLGFGTIQIGAGIERVLGIPAGRTLQLVVIAVAFVLYMASTATGVDRKSTRLNSSHVKISYAVLCLKKKNQDKP